ncbi:MAG: hypothetical protein ACL7BU_00330 [Candidatus Phlomobacter fragariae]
MKTKAPNFYAVLHFTSIIGVLIFDVKWAPQLHIITTIIVGCIILTSLIEFVRYFRVKAVGLMG